MLSVDVSPQVGNGRTIIAGEKVVDQDIHVGVRIPQQLGGEVGAQLRPLTADLAVPLLEVGDGGVVDEVAQVGLQDAKIGEGADEVRELDDEIPDQQAVRDPRPILQFGAEGGSGGIGGYRS